MQYFIKGGKIATPELLERHKLGYAFDSQPASSEPLTGGPNDAGAGCYVSRFDTKIGGLPGYKWESISDSVLFGYRADYTPTDYARPSMLPGEIVKLADGNEWLIPTACEFYTHPEGIIPITKLPQSWKNVDGQWLPGNVVKQYSALWDMALDLSARYFVAQDEQKSSGITVGEVLTLASLAIQANYYLSAAECSVLGLLANSQEIMSGVIDAVFGLKRLEELQKKTT